MYTSWLVLSAWSSVLQRCTGLQCMNDDCLQADTHAQVPWGMKEFVSVRFVGLQGNDRFCMVYCLGHSHT